MKVGKAGDYSIHTDFKLSRCMLCAHVGHKVHNACGLLWFPRAVACSVHALVFGIGPTTKLTASKSIAKS